MAAWSGLSGQRPWVVTHIHLDHAGGAGDIAAMYPQAEIVVHERGARHLADPARLMASARMVYGDALDGLFGLIDSVSGDLYVGDAAGVYIPETADLRPATPPPDFDLATALNSLRTFAALRPTGCCSAITDRWTRSTRSLTGRPRRSRCGWRRPGAPATPGLTSITRWPWCTSGPGSATPC